MSGNMYAALALIVWGCWGFVSKLTTERIHPSHAIVYEVIGSAIVGLAILFYWKFKLDTDPLGILYSTITGICVSLGGVLFLIALARGNAYVVTTVTSLYPIVTLVLLFLVFREPITVKQGIGILLGLSSFILLSV